MAIRKEINPSLIRCPNCGRSVEKENAYRTSWGGLVCESCYLQYDSCAGCGQVHKKNEMKLSSTDDEFYCVDCYNVKYIICSECGDEVRRDNSHNTSDGRTICNDCFYEHYTTCHSCGVDIYRDDASYSEDEDEYYCNDCFGSNAVIKDYSFIPETFSLNSIPYEKKNKLFLGIELEVETKQNYAAQAKALYGYMKSINIENNFYMKWDGSIDGFEIVSHPFTVKYAHDKLHFYNLLKWLQSNKFTSFKSGRCGLHVHLSRKFFLENEIEKMRLFFYQNRKELDKFSCRHGKNTNYCEFKEYTKTDFVTKARDEGDRYSALNLSSGKNTIEIRIFRGTLHHERFIATMQFCDAVSHFVKEVGCSLLTKNSWNQFIDWCIYKNRYGNFVKYINNKKKLEGKITKQDNNDPDEERIAPGAEFEVPQTIHLSAIREDNARTIRSIPESYFTPIQWEVQHDE